MNKKFKDSYNNIFEVNIKNNLLKFLNPTSKRTKYYDVPPDKSLTKNQYGRIYLQIHQLLHLLNSLGFNFKNKKFLDVGTGNGMIPRILSRITKFNKTIGIDPFLDKGHKTSWQKHDHEQTEKYVLNFIKRNKGLFYNKYKKGLNYENHSLIPSNFSLKNIYNQKYKFHQLSAHNSHKLKEKFDVIYLKSIEHFNDWNKMFKISSKITKKKSLIIFKHRSFFSYLGPHRYATSGIPWGHVLLKDKDYKKYINKFHKERSKDMENFFFNGLSYPRYTINDLLLFASKNNFTPKIIINEPPRYLNDAYKFTLKIQNFWRIVFKNYPRLSSDELLSGIYHIVLEKN